MTKEQIIQGYLMNSHKVVAEMLYDTIERYENRSCENCKYKLQNECSAQFLIVCKRHPRLPDHYEEPK